MQVREVVQNEPVPTARALLTLVRGKVQMGSSEGITAVGRFVETIDRFSARVAKENEGIRIVRVPSPDGSIVRFLVAPGDRFKDGIPDAQRARQIDAGALPPEVYGHDLFELVNGECVRLRDGSRMNLSDESSLRKILDRFFQSGSYDHRLLAQCVDDIREGQRASRKRRS